MQGDLKKQKDYGITPRAVEDLFSEMGGTLFIDEEELDDEEMAEAL